MIKSLTEQYVTKAEASRRLGITRPLLDRILSRGGSPSPNAAKRYDFAALSAFVESQRSSGLDSLRDARLAEVNLRCEKLRRELDLDSRKTVRREDVDAFHATLALRLRSFLYVKLETEMPPKIAGCDAMTIRQYGRALADEMVSTLSRDVSTWEKS